MIFAWFWHDFDMIWAWILHNVAMKHNHAAISQHNKSKYGPQFGTKGTKVIISKNTKGGTPTGLPKK